MKRIIIFILFFQVYLFPQYSSADHDLVKTTFLREFNKDIILPYLDSQDERKINAALLSISHSQDTMWIDEIIKLPFEKFSREISFTIGQLPSAEKSVHFLLEKIQETDNSRYLLEALGKITDQKSIKNIMDIYYPGESKMVPNGISLFVYQAFNRGLISIDTTEQILMNVIRTSHIDEEKLASLFAFSRIGCSENNKVQISKELIENFPFNISGNEHQLNAEQFLLQFLKKMKYFPNDLALLKAKLNSNNPLIRIETAQIGCYFKFDTAIELEKYFALLDDDNPNVRRAAAASLKELEVNENLSGYLKEFIEQRIRTIKNNLIKEELLLSYLDLFKPNFAAIKNSFEKYVLKSSLYLASADDPQSSAALSFLLDNYNSEILPNKINILNSLVRIHHSDIRNKKVNDLLLDALDDNSAPLISIAADGLDSVFIKRNSKKISQLIIESVEKRKDDPAFLESLISLAILSKKISEQFYTDILTKLAGSKIYSIRKYYAEKLGGKVIETKDEGNFEELWINSFKSYQAEIETKKGKFLIKFLPEFAPISVGNFIYLAENKIFDKNKFHRVVPGFVIQGGDPTVTGWGGPGYDIVSEFSWLEYDPGTVGMASAGKDTEGSQWFVTVGSYPHLNGRYTIFGKIIEGFETVNILERNDAIISVKLIN